MNMNALESPLEALAFFNNYVIVGHVLTTVVVNNIWKWVAVLITAAVSFFWSIRVVAAADLDNTRCEDVTTSQPNYKEATTCLPDTVHKKSASASNNNNNISNCGSSMMILMMMKRPTIESSIISDDDVGGVTRGRNKLTVYYEGDHLHQLGGSNSDEEAEGIINNIGGVVGEIWNIGSAVGNWDIDIIDKIKMLKMREMGWYRFQDLTLLHGNVVRLWDSHSTHSQYSHSHSHSHAETKLLY